MSDDYCRCGGVVDCISIKLESISTVEPAQDTKAEAIAFKRALLNRLASFAHGSTIPQQPALSRLRGVFWRAAWPHVSIRKKMVWWLSLGQALAL
jgi:hypothetical protein